MLRFGALTLAAGLCLTAPAHADDVLHPGAVNVDRPTLVTLGLQLLISGDDDHDAASLAAALNAAQPGDVITIADGTYASHFLITASGTADDPIVIRGSSEAGTILDGQGSSGNVLDVYGSFVHVERLTLQNANRALRFQGAATEGNVARRLHIRDVRLGIGSRQDQRDFYLCDNVG